MRKRQYARKPALDTSVVSAGDLLQTRPFQSEGSTAQRNPRSQQDFEPTNTGFDLTTLQLLSDPQSASALGQPLQAKLTIGQPNGKYEQEADRVAHDVVQRMHSAKASETVAQQPMRQDETIQMKSLLQPKRAAEGEASSELESSINRMRGTGQPLEANLQRQMGQAMGADFSGVRVHTSSQADQLNRSIQAKAFTTGQDVFFQQGAYQPGSRGGQELIAHELTHVVQQKPNTRLHGQNRKEASTQQQEQTPDIARQQLQPISSAQNVAQGQIQRVLSKDGPIDRNDVVSVSNPHGNVYILEGAQQDSVVVKFEVAGAEGADKLTARYKKGEELAQSMIDAVPRKQLLTPNDINELSQIPPNTPGVAPLLRVLNLGIANAGVGIKMDKMQVGQNLMALARQPQQNQQHLQRILDPGICRRLGQMAFFDVLTRNFDRFRADGSVAEQNIDFDANYQTAIAFDNIYVMNSLVSNSSQANVAEMESVKSTKRKEYAHTAILNLLRATGLPLRGNFTKPDMQKAETSFALGMSESARKAKQKILEWQDVMTQTGWQRQINQHERDVIRVLTMRMEYIENSGGWVIGNI